MKEAVLLVIFASILAAVVAGPCCGDGRCEFPIEDCGSCPQDCGVCPKCATCGNRVCDSAKGETTCNCPLDCGPCCVDGVCREDKNETALNCPQDCAVVLKIQVVDDATNAPLSQAAVRCSTPTVTLGPRLSASSGNVQFDNAAGASYTCTGELYSYLPGYVVATVFPVSDPQVFIIRLKKNPACLEGTVYDAITLVPLDNSTVFCTNGVEVYTTATRITGSMGKYYYEPVPAGDYRCFASRTKYFPNSNDGSVEPGKMGIVDVYLQPLPGGIIGHVWIQNGTQLIGIPGATVTCTGASALPVATTDATGFYSIQNVPAGPVSCTASLTDYTSDFKSGTVFRGQNTTIDFIIAELPGQLIVHVQEEVTLVNISNANVECSSVQVPILPGVTDATGTVGFGQVTAGTFRCNAVATGYFPNSLTGIIVIRNKKTEVTILLKPLPGTLIITTVDDVTNELLNATSVVVNGVNNYGPQLTDVTGTTQFTVVAGSYSAVGTLTGYLPGSKTGFPVPKGVITRVELRLIPLPGTLIVNVVATDLNNGPLPGATVVVDSQTSTVVFTNSSTAPAPSASITYTVRPGIYRAFGSAVGYNTDTKLSALIGRNQTVTVTLVLSPLPNVLIVQVLDIQTNAPITFAQVSLTGTNTANSGVDGTAQAYFGPYGAGNWSASATATGYAANSTYVGSALRNQTLFAIIYLRQLPCTIRVLVVDNSTNPLALATVSITGITGTTLTDANGITTYTQQFDFATNPVASASLTGYTSGTSGFTCGRGFIANVTIVLFPLPNTVIVQVLDITDGKPITFAQVNLGGSVIRSSGVDAVEAKAIYTPLPGGNYSATASATGYGSNGTYVGLAVRNQTLFAIIYLSPLPGGIIGHVWVNQTGTLVPLEGATVVCTVPGNTRPSANTDTTGFYSIQSVPAGNVACTASLTDYTSDSKTGVVIKGQNTTIDFILYEIPGVLIVRVQEVVTLVNISGASVSCTSNFPALTGTTDSVGLINFGTVNSATYSCFASATGYANNSVTGVAVTRNKATTITILLTPLPGTLIITTVDATTSEILTNASVVVNGNQNFGPQFTAVDGTTQFTVPSGTYSSTGSLTGYISGTETGFNVPRGVITRVTLRLTPLPGTLIVNVIATDLNNGPLPGATVVVDAQTTGVVFTNTSTAPAPSASITYSVKPGVYRAFGSAVGYNTDTKISAAVGRNQTVTVTLVLTPLPNFVIVQVLDILDNSPITTANVTLSGSSSDSSAVNAQARSNFGPYNAGNWSAAATATGYAPNSTYVGSAVRNTTLFAVIYLRQLPCTVNIIVVSNNTGAVIPGATVSLTGVDGTTTTNAQGVTTYSLAYNFATSPIALASRTGYNNGSSEIIVCGRGFFVNVTIKLNEVLTIKLAAIDALTSGKPLLPLATIYFDGVVVSTKDPVNPAFRYQVVQSLPITAVIKGTAGGFNNKTSDPITFTLANREFNISLAPQEFTLYFIPAEVMADGSYKEAGADGSIRNNYAQFFNETGLKYEEKPITAGGSATQQSDPPTSQSFTANTYISYVSENSAPFYAFAAKFTDQSPSNQTQFSAFYVQSKDLDTLKANAPNNASQLFVPVPDFAATAERTIVFDLPYKLNAAYFNIRVTPVNPTDYSKRNFGSQDFCFARVTLKKAVRYTNYDTGFLGGGTRAVFESYITFGDFVNSIEIGFPVETYNNTLSTWADTEAFPFPNVRPYAPGTAPASLSSFSWPPQSLSGPLFTTIASTGQLGRNPSAKLFLVQDYVLVYQPRTKRTNSN